MALSRQDVQIMLDALEQTLSSRISNFLVSEGQPVKDAINAHNAVILDHEQRMTNLVEVFNSTTGETIAEVKRQQEVLSQQQGAASQALNKTQELDGRLKDLKESMEKYAEGRDVMVKQLRIESTKLRTDTEFEFNKLKGEIE